MGMGRAAAVVEEVEREERERAEEEGLEVGSGGVRGAATAAVAEEVEREEREEGLEVATIDDHGDGRIDNCEEVDVAGAVVRMVRFKIAMVMLLLLRTRERK